MVAVVAVIADHLFLWPAGGFVGVDIFFVISGFLITGLLLREWERTGSISFWGFYRRRIKRIIPAALLVVVATITAAHLVFSSVRFDRTLLDGVWATFFGANWRFALQGTDYFDADQAVSPLQHYWSLAVEEQFYFVWPWLLLLTFWTLARLGRKGDAPPRELAFKSAFLVILILSAASFAWAMYESSTNATFAYFSTFSRAWELGIGAILAVIARIFSWIPAVIRPVLAWIGIAGIVLSFFLVRDDAGFPAPGAILPVLSTALVIAAGTEGEQGRSLFPLTNPVSRYIGDISYSLYLWHFPAIIFAGEVFQSGSRRYYALALMGTAVGAIASYHLVENPIRRSRWLEPDKGHSRLRVALSATLTVAVCATAIGGAYASTSSSQGSAPLVMIEDVPKLSPEQLSAALEASVHETEWPKLSPNLDAISREHFDPEDSEGCDNKYHSGKDCTEIVDDPGRQTVVVVGNSSAVAYLPMIRAVFERQGWEVIALTMRGCQFVDRWTRNNSPELTKACPLHKKEALAAIERIQPDMIISSNLYAGRLSPRVRKIAQASMLQQLSKSTDDVILLAPAPGGPSLADCKTNNSKPSDCSHKLSQKWLTFSDIEKRVAKRKQSWHYIDTRAWYCTTSGSCPSFADSTPIKRDRTHITRKYALMLVPSFESALNEIGRMPEPGANSSG